MSYNYNKSTDKSLSPIEVVDEAARCLLCEDAPCSQDCPAETNPGKFIRSLRFRNLFGAIETIRENNPMGAVCARVCPTEKYCEKACSRCGIDKPIRIGKLQEYLTDYEAATGFKALKKANTTREKVAVIGSGPAGLSAASMLSRLGFKVTVFEMKDRLGGFLSYGIPGFHLNQNVVDKEINYIKELGVEFKTGVAFGKDVTFESLKKEGYKAFLIAIGLTYGKIIDLFKKNENCVSAVDFLSEVKSKDGKVKIPNNILVIGGGDAAMDSGMTAKVLGAQNVKIVTRKPWENFRASKSQVEHARKLNISIIDGFAPVAVDGKTVTFESQVDNTELKVTPDKIILAFGQEGNAKELFDGIDLDDANSIISKNYKTNLDNVFVAGDIMSGSERTVVAAVRDGKKAAEKINEYLGGKGKC